MSNEKKFLLNPKGEVLYEGRSTDEIVETLAGFYIEEKYHLRIYEGDSTTGGVHEFCLSHYPTKKEMLYYIALAEKQTGTNFYEPVIEVTKRYYRYWED